MKLIQQAVLALLCAALGAVAGFKYAKVAEHNRLERNKTLVRLTHDPRSKTTVSNSRKVIGLLQLSKPWTVEKVWSLEGRLVFP
jgi:hypothetical protein